MLTQKKRATLRGLTQYHWHAEQSFSCTSKISVRLKIASPFSRLPFRSCQFKKKNQKRNYSRVHGSKTWDTIAQKLDDNYLRYHQQYGDSIYQR
jgi:hypothetical protein